MARKIPDQISIPLPTSVTTAFAAAPDGVRILAVGGCVRDALLGVEPKDIDIEVYGISYDGLVELLVPHGRADVVGRSFGVVRFVDDQGHEVDVSIPRRESRIGRGHADFSMTFDADISPVEAAARRDFTINAMAWDPLTGEIVDHFGGLADLEAGILRATSPAFAEDALRVLRGMQFASRFDMRIDPDTANMCRDLMPDYPFLARERVSEEWMKLATRSPRPGLMWDWLKATGWIDLHPHLAKLVDVPQDPEWHPEGPVDVHTALVMDAMARICDREGIVGDDRAVMIFAALTHDLAKSFVADGGTTMLRMKRGAMRWTAHGHEAAGGPMAREFLEGIGIKEKIIARVVPLVENHLQYMRAEYNRGDIKVTRQVAELLKPSTMRELTLLVEADHSGRPPIPPAIPADARHLAEVAKQQGIYDRVPSRIVLGRHLLPSFGGKPNREIGLLVEQAHQAWINGVFDDLDGGLAYVDRTLGRRYCFLRGADVSAYPGVSGQEIGNIITAAWEAQKAGDIRDRESAIAWLEREMALRNALVAEGDGETGPQDSAPAFTR